MASLTITYLSANIQKHFFKFIILYMPFIPLKACVPVCGVPVNSVSLYKHLKIKNHWLDFHKFKIEELIKTV